MKIILFTLFYVFIFAAANGISGGVFIYPDLESGGDCIEELVPERWSVLDSAHGDLNGDSIADIAAVFEFEDSVRFVSNDEYNPDTSFYRPRILAVYFKDDSLGRYVFMERNNTFIVSRTHPNMIEPYEDMQIENGTLKIKFSLWWITSPWWATNATYEFRYQNGQFALIFCEYMNAHRETLQSICYRIDFIKENYTVTKMEPIDSSFWGTTDLKKITYPEIRTLRSLIRPFEWEFEEGITI